MSNYIVVYDLDAPGQDYADLIKHLKTYPTHWHFQKSAWIVGPAESAYVVANKAKQFLDSNDLILVQRLTQDSAWWGYEQEGSDWIAEAIE